MMLYVLALLLQTAPVRSHAGDEIIVTARPLSSTKAALDNCLARHCPPADDIESSLAHAENQFLVGDYQAARTTLLAARSRNRRFAAEIPTEVGDLLRANGRIASLNGHVNEGKLGQIESIEALKAGLASDDRRVLLQRLEIGNAFIKLGRYRAASDVYRRVARQARKAELPAVEGAALLRRAMLFSALSEFRGEYRPTARNAIRDITSTTNPALQPYRDAVPWLGAKIAGSNGDVADVDAIAARYHDKPTAAPVLLYQPTIDLEQAPDPQSGVVRLSGPNEPAWVDFGFSIDAAGRTHDVAALRQSSSARRWWIDKVSTSIAERRYAPMIVPKDKSGVERVERFSMVYDLVGPSTGSRIVTRVPKGRLESIDLTVDTPNDAVGIN